MNEEDKALSKIRGLVTKGIVFGTYKDYKTLSWTGVKKLEDLSKYNDGKEALQEAYDIAKETGKYIFNNLIELQKLGVKL